MGTWSVGVRDACWKSKDLAAHVSMLYHWFVFQPPFDGEDDDQLFNSIMEKSVNYPKSLSEPAKLLLQGVGPGSVLW